MRWLPACSLLLVACAHPKPAPIGPKTTTHGPVEIRDTLPQFLDAMSRDADGGVDATMDDWRRYETQNSALLEGALAVLPDPGDEKLRKLAVSREALVSLVSEIERNATADADAALDALQLKTGEAAPMVLAFAVSRRPDAVMTGALGQLPLVLLNARSASLASPGARRAAIAREAFRMEHRFRTPGNGTLSPVAAAIYREGAAVLAARLCVPNAFEPDVLGLPEELLTRLHGREALIAQELLTALDSSSAAERERFFDPALKDPLLPPGAGPFIADRLFQRLAGDLGHPTKALQLTPDEFLRRARKVLPKLGAR